MGVGEGISPAAAAFQRDSARPREEARTAEGGRSFLPGPPRPFSRKPKQRVGKYQELLGPLAPLHMPFSDLSAGTRQEAAWGRARPLGRGSGGSRVVRCGKVPERRLCFWRPRINEELYPPFSRAPDRGRDSSSLLSQGWEFTNRAQE